MDRTPDLDLKSLIRLAQVSLPCADVGAALNFLVERLGFKVNAIFPADAPLVAVVSGHGVTLRLETAHGGSPAPATLRLSCNMTAIPAGVDRDFIAPGGLRIILADARPAIDVPVGTHEFVVSKMDGGGWGVGRAGMLYRDLIPSRLGGRFIASHIRIPDGGPVPDYVHFHRIRFQMIFCRAGWAKLVYEDQGEPFLLQAGDCVLQPPEIRHRVLESSPGLEVIEVGCPAVHETHADHALSLPTGRLLPERGYGGQRFVRHVAARSPWQAWRAAGFEARDTGIEDATDGLAGARVVRPLGQSDNSARQSEPAARFEPHGGEFLFFFALTGWFEIEAGSFGRHRLRAGDSCVIPPDANYAVRAGGDLELLEVSLPARLPEAVG